MNIIITMAGRGQRFKDAGYNVPKYQIEVKGKTLFEWSMTSLKSFFSEKFIFIVLKEDQSREFISNQCKNLGIEKFAVIEIDEVTRGQAESAMLARPEWNFIEPMMIYNIDTYVEAGQMSPEKIPDCNGWIPCFNAAGDHWSFVSLDENGKAIEVREKKRISDNCSIGAYYFKSAGEFEYLYNEFYSEANADKNTERGERYIAPMYNFLIEAGGDVRIMSIDSKFVHVLGTPEEVKAFSET